jgi:hypothetical protein
MSSTDIYKDLLLLHICASMCPFRTKVNSSPLLLISMTIGKCFTVLLEGGDYHSEKHVKC